MMRELEQVGVTENVMQFKFNRTRPDLTKLDMLFGLLFTETENFEQQVQKMEVDIAADGLHSVLGGLNVKEKHSNQKTTLICEPSLDCPLSMGDKIPIKP